MTLAELEKQLKRWRRDLGPLQRSLDDLSDKKSELERELADVNEGIDTTTTSLQELEQKLETGQAAYNSAMSTYTVDISPADDTEVVTPQRDPVPKIDAPEDADIEEIAEEDVPELKEDSSMPLVKGEKIAAQIMRNGKLVDSKQYLILMRLLEDQDGGIPIYNTEEIERNNLFPDINSGTVSSSLSKLAYYGCIEQVPPDVHNRGTRVRWRPIGVYIKNKDPRSPTPENLVRFNAAIAELTRRSGNSTVFVKDIEQHMGVTGPTVHNCLRMLAQEGDAKKVSGKRGKWWIIPKDKEEPE